MAAWSRAPEILLTTYSLRATGTRKKNEAKRHARVMPVVEIELQDIAFAVDVINAIPRDIRDICVRRSSNGGAGTIRVTFDEHLPSQENEGINAAAVALATLASGRSEPTVHLCSPYVTTLIWRGDDDFTCPICQEAIETREELVVLSCGHHFHSQCAHSLKMCAVCRCSS